MSQQSSVALIPLNARQQRRIEMLTRVAEQALESGRGVFWLPLSAPLKDATRILSAERYLAQPRYLA